MVIEPSPQRLKELLQGIQMYVTYRGKFKVEQRIYEMIASNFIFNFILKELLYVKNYSSKYELKLSASGRVPTM
jgi:hypothetical protein